MEEIRFLTPISGVMLGDIAGKPEGGSLWIDVALKSFAGRRITVNGREAEDHAGIYTVKVPLTAYRNVLTARDETTGAAAESIVYRLKNDSMKYRLSLDDNIWFFQDIARKQYDSLFDNPYLALYRDMHEKYGTKVHLNMYYCCPEFGGFNLTQFPDRYKGEWEKASEWLRLSFHALKNLPDQPYIRATYDQAYGECEMVNREIERFAGKSSMSDYTTIHWCEGTKEACRAFRDNGYRTLQGGTVGNGTEPIDYYIDDEAFWEGVRKFGYYHDEEEGITVTSSNVCLNSFTPEQIPKKLDSMTSKYPLCGFIDLIIHEQYFYPHYVNYLPDYRERVEAGIRWCAEHGYEPSFRSEPLRPY